jgi:universal protein Kae1
MICLGIESTAHTFGIGMVDEKGKILVDEKDVYRPEKGKGIIPQEAAEHHRKVKEEVLKKALEKVKLKMENVDLIAYSFGPGLPPCLLAGADFAIELSKKYNKRLIPINHSLAHVEIGKLTTGSKDPIVVYLSGGNTQIISFVDGRYRVFGETMDIPIGNAIDSLSRQIGIEPPYGPNFDKAAEKGKEYADLPYVVKGMDLSFSGIVTDAVRKFKLGMSKEDVCHSMQEICYAIITEVTERAIAHTGKKEVLLVGGVAASSRMQKMMEQMCLDRGAKLYVVPKEYSGDCGVNIAWTGLLAYKSKWKKSIKDKFDPKWRIDDVEITWLK